MINIPKDTLDLIEKSVSYVRKNVEEMDHIHENMRSDFYEKLRNKNIEGYKKYGEFKFENNNMYQMMEEEILDAINYCCYELIKMEKLELKNDNVVDLLDDLIIDYKTLQDIKISVTEKLEKHFNS